MEHTFSVELKGSDGNQAFVGQFTYKRPNIRTKSEIAKTAASLKGGLQGLDADTKFLHEVLATLRHTITESPDWWQKADYGYELYDVNVVFDIYKACNDFEAEWFDKVWSEEDKDEDKDEKSLKNAKKEKKNG